MTPQDIDNLTLAFPASVEHLMPFGHPEWKRYRSEWPHGKSWGFKLFENWFYCGLKNLKLQPKPGMDADKCLRHIRAIMGSFEPSHEDKTAACALLFEQWFESATWEKKKAKP